MQTSLIFDMPGGGASNVQDYKIETPLRSIKPLNIYSLVRPSGYLSLYFVMNISPAVDGRQLIFLAPSF